MNCEDTLTQEQLAFAQNLVDQVRPLALQYFRQPLDVESKADASPVTRADREIEALLRSRIQAQFPADGIFGEEYGAEKMGSEYVWVVDPIDGTKSFISGMPTYGTLIALLRNERAHMGVIDMPALNERWVGCQGLPSTFNGVPCQTRRGVALQDAVLYATSPDVFRGEDAVRYEALCAKVGLRRFGGDCYAYGMLASGWIDGVVEATLQPYDYLSLVPVIEGAGGVITDWDGQALNIRSDGRVLAAATPQLHAQMLMALRG